MCSRYENERSAADYAERLGGIVEILEAACVWQPRADHRPTHEVLTIFERDGGLKLGTGFWGFPLPQPGKKPKPVINARIESLDVSPFWRGVQRCWLPATSWIEWIEVGGKNVVQRIAMPDGEPFLLAGVCAQRDGIFRVSMCMQPAPEKLAYIHHRAPLVYDLGSLTQEQPDQVINRVMVMLDDSG